MNSLLLDCRIGLRYLRRHPGLTLVSILTLALGIAATTMIFALVNAVLLKPLPFYNAKQLHVISEGFPQLGFGAGTFSAADFDYYRQKQHVMEGVAAFQNVELELSGVSQPERVVAGRVTASLFPLLGVNPVLGRPFNVEEDRPGNNVVVLSYGLWQRRFGMDRNIVGKPLRLNRESYTVVGVMPADFKFPLPGLLLNSKPGDLWLPMAFTPAELQGWGSRFNFTVLGRLKENVTLEAARAESSTMAAQIEGQYPAAFAQYMHGAHLQVELNPYHQQIVGRVRTLLLLLLGAVILVLGIGCANISALLLSRAVSRKKEIAIRSALGARYISLLRQWFAENLVLALIGGALGWLLAFFGQAWFQSMLPSNVPILNQTSVGGNVLAFTFVLSILLSLVLSAAMPVLLLRPTKLGDALYEAGVDRTMTRAGRRMHSAFVTAEFTLSVLLLISAGLLLRSFQRLLAVDPGFQYKGVMAVRLPLPVQSYPQAAQIRSFYNETLNRIAGYPGIEAAGMANDLPLHATDIGPFQIEGAKSEGGMTPPVIHFSWILGNYLQALNVPLSSGRLFTPEDRQGTLPVAIINTSMARTFWPGQETLGRRLRWGGGGDWLTIVGVVQDVKDDGLRADATPHVYAAYPQQEDAFVADATVGELRSMNLVVRSGGDPTNAIQQIDFSVHQLDPDVALTDVHTLAQDVYASMASERFSATIVGSFAAAALLLAALGVYAVIAFSVAQQTREIGVRMALGAQRGNVLRMVVMSGLRLAIIGIFLGMSGAWFLTSYMRTLLFGVKPVDAITFLSVPLVLLAVALLACYIPARRATRVDVIQALRYE